MHERSPGLGHARYPVAATVAACALLFAATPSFAVLTTETLASGFSSPAYVTAPPGDTERLFVSQLGGQIRIIRLADGSVDPVPFLDIDALVLTSGERGLFALAFHPDYATNGFFFVHYTDNSGNTVVARYTVSADPDVANAATAVTYLTAVQPFPNHNGGSIAFQPGDANHYLYVALGDGGSGGDPDERAQNLTVKLGKMLRLDVDAGPSTAPASNPFVDGPGGNEDLIWAYGLRNPWRFSFDSLTGDMYIGDVGQNDVEEIDFQASDSTGGENYGWDLLEGSADFECVFCEFARNGTVLPIHEYAHVTAQAVIGGYVYRGTEFPTLTGRYFFADSSSAKMWSFVYEGSPNPSVTERTAQLNPGGASIVSFGEDGNGELYMVDVGDTGSNGVVKRIIETVPFTALQNVFADFVYTGPQFGTQPQPYRTVQAALDGVLSGGSITFEAGSTDAALTISKPVTLQASGGSVTIGGTPARRPKTHPSSGFISND